jgi:hypothetical protein
MALLPWLGFRFSDCLMCLLFQSCCESPKFTITFVSTFTATPRGWGTAVLCRQPLVGTCCSCRSVLQGRVMHCSLVYTPLVLALALLLALLAAAHYHETRRYRLHVNLQHWTDMLVRLCRAMRCSCASDPPVLTGRLASSISSTVMAQPHGMPNLAANMHTVARAQLNM